MPAAADVVADSPEVNHLLEAPLRRTVLWLALPVLGEQLLHFFVGLYDVYLSGHLPGEITREATSAVGVAAYVGWLATLVFSLVATGASALISRATGARDEALVHQVVNRAVCLSLVVGLLFLMIAGTFAGQFAQAMGLTGASASIAERYLRIDAIGLLFSSFSAVVAASLRARGDMRTPLGVFALVNVVNVGVSSWLVYGGGPVPTLGVDGIVLGTLAARFTGGLLFCVYLLRGVRGLRFDLHELHLRGETVRRILRLGAPAAAEGVVMWGGHCLFLRIISGLGEAPFAAHIVGIRLEGVTYLPAVAWGAAAATMVGQSLGAGLKSRAVAAGHEAARQCSVFGLGITLWFTLGAERIFAVMHQDPQVQALGGPALRYVGFFQLPLIASIVYFTALRGAGDTRFPLGVTILCTYLIRLPVAYVCGVTLQGGLIGAWTGMNLDMLLRGAIALTRFTRQKWVDTRV